MLSCHSLTFLSAVHARLRTLLAMIHFMLRAFLSACTADLGAKGTKFFSVITFATHQYGGQPTNVRAVAVKLDAACHHFYVILTQASRGARVAHKGTVRTSLDTGCEH